MSPQRPNPRQHPDSPVRRRGGARLVAGGLVAGIAAAALAVPAARAVAAPAPAPTADAGDVVHAAPGGTGRTPGVTPAATTRPPGTIVFLKNDNVWIARGDGTNARAVTTDGAADRPYFSPSEADNGTIAAAHLGDIVRMTQKGVVLNRIDPPPLKFGSGETFDGTPADVAISPDGKYIAWSFVAYTCPVDQSCAVRYATGYTTATALNTAAGHATNYHAPSWIGSTRTLQSGGYNVQMMLQDRKASPVHWFDDHDVYFPSTDLADAELSRNGRWLGAVRGYAATQTVIWYSVTGNARTGTPPVAPTPLCVTNAGAGATSPTFSPDSTAMAWSSTAGVYVKSTLGDCSVQPKLILKPGATRPAWSAAELVK